MFWNEDDDILDIIGGAKERLLDARAFAAAIDQSDDVMVEAARYFEVYEEALRAAGAIDFADMVPLVANAMARDEAYYRAIAGAYDHVLVDEYQDVNPRAVETARSLRARRVALWAVGDDDQTLYSFRASDVRHIIEFKRRHPDSAVHVLDRNYRAAAGLVGAARQLIRNNKARVDKDYAPVTGTPGEVVIRGYADAGYRGAAGRARHSTIDKGRHIARQHRRALSDGRHRPGVPEHPEGDGAALRGAWRRRPLAERAGAARRRGPDVSVRRRQQRGPEPHRQQQARRDRPRAARSGGAGHCRQLHRRHPARATHRRQRGPVPGLRARESRVAGDRRCGDRACPWLGLIASAREQIVEQSRALRNPPEDAVVLSTVHSAKGLEWDTVFLAGLEDGVLPHINAEDLEEERRIAYVGITRARLRLGLTYAAWRYGETARPWSFLREIGGRHKDSTIACGPVRTRRGPTTSCRSSRRTSYTVWPRRRSHPSRQLHR